MKKFLVYLMIAVFLVAPVIAYSAGITATATPVYNRADGKLEMLIVDLTCGTVGASSPDYTATVINTISGVDAYSLVGMYLYEVRTKFDASSPVTINTDLTITDSWGVDLLGGAGTDLLDSADYTAAAAGTTATYFPRPITGNITLNITNNLVNNAVTYIRAIFTAR